MSEKITEKYRLLFEDSPDSMILADPGTAVILDVNSETCRLIGRSKDELIGRLISVLHPERLRSQALKIFKEDVEFNLKSGSSEPREFYIVKPGGQEVPIQIHTKVVNIHGRNFMFGIFRDLTEIKALEDKFRKLGQRLDMAAQFASIGVWEWNALSGEIDFTDTIETLFGRGMPVPATSDDWYSHIHPDDLPATLAFLEELKSQPCQRSIILKGTRGDGTQRHIQISAGSLPDADGKVARLVGTVLDITEHITAVINARKAEEELRELIESTPVAMMIVDRRMKGVYANPRMLELFGWGPEVVLDIERFLASCFPDELCRAGISVRIQEACKADSRDSATQFHERFTCGDGSIKHIIFRHRSVGERILFTFIDQTDAVLKIEEARLDEARSSALLRLSQSGATTAGEFLNAALEEIVRFTRSRVGFLFNYNEESHELLLQAWSSGVMEINRLPSENMVFRLEDTGLNGEAVRLRKPVIINDYAGGDVPRKGYPEGHLQIKRFLSAPVFDGDRIVGLAGVANSDEPYTEPDVRQLSQMLDTIWKIAERKRIEESLRDSEERYRIVADNTFDWEFWRNQHGGFNYISPSCE
ncbi:MAG: PAS domain S-box protein, partial [Myxococcota bacterium]